MKLFYKAGACSLASHIALLEMAADFTLEAVDTVKGATASGADYRAINPKGYVPALALADGEILTEGPAILLYLADQAGAGVLAPLASRERARMVEQLIFTSSELHRAFKPLFRPGANEADQQAARAEVAQKLAHVEAWLADGRDYVVGEHFTVADAYLFVVANWTGFTGMTLDPWPHLAAHHQRIAERPAVRAAMQGEGLRP
ncbi:glutathione transferase GstA [Sphingopyxis sp. MWB1]|uniref:glutathione transferase GstA n=1 Tax=Sphingopyxis sp. MWB1 TaxID=1537715 RepID=UPI000519F9D8|nr:glutathione transferase GstA [Sphingopyxis sp. MWB1]